jgi:L,D-transpeptidase ErfK/SrfK
VSARGIAARPLRYLPGLAAAIALAAALPAAAAEFPLMPGATAIGAVETHVVAKDETLLDIARHFDLGYVEIVAANPGVDPWLPGVGRRVVLPMRFLLPNASRRGIVVNLAQRRLFYFPPQGGTVETFPVGVAVDGLDSQLGVTRVVAKETDPAWYPPVSIRAEQPELPREVPPGPTNPLGHYALRLGWPGYLIHGTNKPDGVGRNVSHGCLHLYPEDIAKLYGEVRLGTPVRILSEPTLAQWDGGDLYLQVFPDKEQADALDIGKPMPIHPPHDLVARLAAAAGNKIGRVDWTAVERAGRARNGLPVMIVALALAADPAQ